MQPGSGGCAFILLSYRNSDLFKVAACTAALAMPLVWPVFLKNRSEANVVTKFEPWLYVSQAMEAIGMKDRLSGWLAFVAVALPIYLVGSLWSARDRRASDLSMPYFVQTQNPLSGSFSLFSW